LAAVSPAAAATFPDDPGCAAQDAFPSAGGLDGARMGALALHQRPPAAAVYPGLAAADESVVLAAGHWNVREKYQAAARDFPSAAGLDFRWAAAAPVVEQADELPECQAQQRPAAQLKVVWLEPQLLIEAAGLRAAQGQPPGEWVSAH
jgi:hypothetical protein